MPKTFTDQEKGDTRDQIGARFGVSGPTTMRLLGVAKGVAKLVEQGRTEESADAEVAWR